MDPTRATSPTGSQGSNETPDLPHSMLFVPKFTKAREPRPLNRDGTPVNPELNREPARLSGLGSRAFVNLGTKSMEWGRSGGVSLLPAGDVARVGSMVVEPRADLITARVVQCGRLLWRPGRLDRRVAICSCSIYADKC